MNMIEKDREAILNLIGRQLFAFQSLVEELYHTWPDDTEFIIHQLCTHVRDVKQIVQDAANTRNDSRAYMAADNLALQLPSVSLSGADIGFHDGSPLCEDAFRDSASRWYGDAFENGEELPDLPLAERDLAVSTTTTTTESHATTLIPARETDCGGNTTNAAANNGIEHNGRPGTINPAQLHRVPPDRSSPYPESDLDVWTSPTLSPAPITPAPAPKLRKRASCDNDLSSSREPSPVGRRSKMRRVSERPPKGKAGSIKAHYGTKTAQHSGLFSELYHSIAGAESMVQLEGFVSSLRTFRGFPPQSTAGSIANVFHMLDHLDVVQQSCAFWRRMLLYRLAEHRDRLLVDTQERRRSSSRVLRPQRIKRAATEVIDILVGEIYPHAASQDGDGGMDVLQKRRKCVANRLHAARNWTRAAHRFQLGIFALMPFGGEFKAQMYGYETLHDDECGRLLDALAEKDGGYVSKAAAELTPFVRAMYNGDDYAATLRIELIENATKNSMVPLQLVELFPNGGDSESTGRTP